MPNTDAATNDLHIDYIYLKNILRTTLDPPKLFLRLEIGTIQYESKIAQSDNPRYPIDSTFHIQSFQCNLIVQALELQPSRQQPSLHGYASVPLETLFANNGEEIAIKLMKDNQYIQTDLYLKLTLSIKNPALAIRDFQEKISIIMLNIQQFEEEQKLFQEQLQ